MKIDSLTITLDFIDLFEVAVGVGNLCHSNGSIYFFNARINQELSGVFCSVTMEKYNRLNPAMWISNMICCGLFLTPPCGFPT
jgi:hypothetical protein